ncbi:MAG: HD-GYP domain-containing protein [Actinomycetota bacterium]|nr:HD-GYP domain-containing protein [Actinomycetota bacterium]
MSRAAVQRQHKVKVQLAVVFGALGAAIIAFLVWFPGQAPPPLGLWALFTAAFVFFSLRSVEVNDRLLASPTVMVIMTSAVVFGPESAILGVAVMSALGPFQPEDFRDGRWFQPAVNFGQLVISGTVAATIVAVIMSFGFDSGPMWRNITVVAVASALAALANAMVNLQLVQYIVGRVYGRLDVRPWSHMRAIMIPHMGMGFLGGLLGATYLIIGTAALPLIAVVFFVGYLAFESYARLREAQESTIRGFIKALEAKDLYTRGHTERVARFTEMIGEQMGFDGTQLERLRWAALIHDVGKLAVPRELIRKRSRLTDEEYETMQTHVHFVEELLADVDFLQPMIEIASNHHAHYDGNGYHGAGHEHGDTPSKEACILAVADTFDAVTSSRSYRVALTQPYAYAELRRHAGTQFDPEVVEAFIAGMESSGHRYGSKIELTDEEARDIAREGLDEMRGADQIHGRNFPLAPIAKDADNG